MKNLFCASLLSLIIISCSSKSESKKPDLPDPNTEAPEEVLNNLYSSNNGYECDLEIDGSDELTKVFYVNRTSTSDSNDLLHKFYTVEGNSEKVDTDIKIGNFSFWMISYKKNQDEVYSSNTPVINKSNNKEELHKLKLIFDEKVNEFSFEIVSEKFIDTAFVEVDTVETGVISNCVEASYKILKGLD